jgi:hypothetical protein
MWTSGSRLVCLAKGVLNMTAMNISDISLDYMLLRAKQGATNRDYGISANEERLREEEITDLAYELRATHDERHKRKILQIIRYAGSVDPMPHRYIIEPLLDDPLRAYDALFTLCVDWGLTSHYIEKLREFIRGKEAPWYNSTYQGFAVGIAKDYLYHHKEPVLLREIIELYDEPLHTVAERGNAEIALRALFGRDSDPANSDLFIQRAREELAREEAEDFNKQ